MDLTPEDLMNAVAELKTTLRDDIKSLGRTVTSDLAIIRGQLATIQGQFDGMQLEMQSMQRSVIELRLEVRRTNELMFERIHRLEGRAV